MLLGSLFFVCISRRLDQIPGSPEPGVYIRAMVGEVRTKKPVSGQPAIQWSIFGSSSGEVSIALPEKKTGNTRGHFQP